MLKVSRRTDYAVRIMLELGDSPAGRRVYARQVARRTGVPLAFLHKIVGDLARAGLVRTYPGPGGGLVLGRPATTISLLGILESIDGPLCLNMCLLRPKECPRDLTCPAHRVWGRIQAMLVQELKNATLDTLVAHASELKRRPQRSDIPYVFPEAVLVD